MGTNLTVGTAEYSEKFTLANNATFSTGTLQNGTFKANTTSSANSNGKVTNNRGTADHTASAGHVNALLTISRDKGKENKDITESDLKWFVGKNIDQIKNVVEKGNGVYLVEYYVQGEGRADNRKTAYMQFDFETEEEKAAREADEAKKLKEKEEAKRKADEKKAADAKKLRTYSESDFEKGFRIVVKSIWNIFNK